MCQKSDMKPVPYLRPTNIRRHPEKFTRQRRPGVRNLRTPVTTNWATQEFHRRLWNLQVTVVFQRVGDWIHTRATSYQRCFIPWSYLRVSGFSSAPKPSESIISFRPSAMSTLSQLHFIFPSTTRQGHDMQWWQQNSLTYRVPTK